MIKGSTKRPARSNPSLLLTRSVAIGMCLLLASCGDGSKSVVAGIRHAVGLDKSGSSDGAPVWNVENKPGPIGEAPTLTATLTQNDDNGGSVFVTATCDDTTIALEFEYHAKQDDDAHSRIETQGTGQYVHLPYRIDDSDIQEAVSQTNHTNTADAVFAHEMSDADAASPPQPGEVITKGVVKLFSTLLPGLGPQDLRAFLHAQNVRFEVPVSDGTKDVVVIRPQESSFQGFVAACKIDLKRFDDDVAKQQEAEKAAAQAKAEAQADTDARQKEQQEAAAQAAQQRADALKQACTTGQSVLRVTQTVNLEGNEHSSTTYVFSNQMVQANADPEAVADGKCSISFARGTSELTGQVPMSALQVADSGSAPVTGEAQSDNQAPPQ